MHEGIHRRRPRRALPATFIGRELLLAVGLLVALTPSAGAQGEPLQPGRDARLYVRGIVAPLEGTLVSIGAEQVLIDTPDGELAVPRGQVVRSEVLGSRGNTVRGAVIGLGVGLAVGVVAVIGSKDDCQPNAVTTCGIPPDRHEEWLLAVPAVAGAAAGALIGSRIRSSRWVPGFLPQGGTNGAGLGMAWRIPLG